MCSLLVWWSISPSPCWPAYNQNSTCPRNSHIPEITNKWTSLNFLQLWVQSHIKEETYGECDTEVKVTMIVKVKSKRHKLFSIFLLMKSQWKYTCTELRIASILKTSNRHSRYILDGQPVILVLWNIWKPLEHCILVQDGKTLPSPNLSIVTDDTEENEKKKHIGKQKKDNC